MMLWMCGSRWRLANVVGLLAVTLSVALFAPISARAALQPTGTAQQSAAAHQSAVEDPSSTLTDLFAVACRQELTKFPEYLTTKNGTYFRQLAADRQIAIVRRIVLLENKGRPILSTQNDGTQVLRCDTESWTGEIHIGVARVDQNLAFVPVLIKPDRQIDFGMVMTSGGWKLMSIGILMLDFQQLQPEWDAEEMAAREEDAIRAMYKISAAIDTYRNAFEKLPDNLAQLGPAPKEGISPDAAGLLDADMVSAHVGGYNFRYRVVPAGEAGKDAQYELTAVPDGYGKSGKRSFFINGTGKLRAADKLGAPASAADPVIEASSESH